MLTLFAIVGITFVFLSDQQAQASRFYADSEHRSRPDPDTLFSYALNQWVYDTGNMASSLRTHGLVPSMYGQAGNTPFNGIGRTYGRETNLLSWLPVPLRPLVGLEQHDMINYFNRAYDEATYGTMGVPYTFPDHNYAWLGAMNADGGVLARSFVRTVRLPMEQIPPNPPAYDYWVFNPYAPANAWFWNRDTYWVPGTYTPQPAGVFIGLLTATFLSSNPGRTLPIPFLTVLADPTADPSPPFHQYHRRNMILRAMVTRPGPWDHPDFAAPDDVGGDVKNLPPGAAIPGSTPWFGNESHWTLLGFPVQTGADGRRYVPMYAFHIQELDGKINLNAHGGIWGASSAHTSNQGWGGWEVNPFRLFNLPSPGGPTEGLRLFQGQSSAYPLWAGRYGIGATTSAVPPSTFYNLWPLRTPYYSRYDSDGSRETVGYGLSDPFRIAGHDVNGDDTWNFDRFPRHDTKGWFYGPPPPPAVPSLPLGYGAGSLAENLKAGPQAHPMAYNYFVPQLAAAGASANKFFPVSSMEALLRHGDTGTDSLNSDLRHLLVNNMTSPRLRRLVTAHSSDIERPGMLPYWHGDQSTYAIPGAGGPPGSIREMSPRGPFQTSPAGSAVGGDFATPPDHWRAASAYLGRLDINRPLPPYPAVQSVGALPNLGRIVDRSGYDQATLARQDLARDIFRRFIAATGAEGGLNTLIVPPNPPGPIPPVILERYNTLRALAQIAVNIVDARDYDDYNTPFNWGGYILNLFPNFIPDTQLPNEWVFGTELPRVVVNEVYTQFDPPPDPGTDPTDVNVWIELFNPLKGSLPSVDPGLPWGTAKLRMPSGGPGSPAYSIYQVVLARNATGMRDPDNVRGRPINIHNQVAPGLQAIMNDWTDPDAAVPPNTEYIKPSSNSQGDGAATEKDDNYSGIRRNGGTIEFQWAPDRGWYLLGPAGAGFPAGPMPFPDPPVATLDRPEMTYRVMPVGGSPGPRQVTVVLRRLACPHLPPNPPDDATPIDPAQPYNPYITVDYVEGVTPNSTSDPMGTRQSVGKVHPYASRRTTGGPGPAPAQALLKLQTPDPMPPGGPRADQPRHTMLRHNSVEEVNYVDNDTVTVAVAAPIIGAPPGTTDTLRIDYVDNASGGAGGDNKPEPPSITGLGGPPPIPQTLKLPFDWLKHLDREFVSPMELMHVSGFKPHELTQQFMVDRLPIQTRVSPPLAGAVGPAPPAPGAIEPGVEELHQHVIRWFDDAVNPPSPPPMPGLQSNRLHRALELLRTRNRAAGTSQVALQVTAAAAIDPAGFPGYYRVFVNPGTSWAVPGSTTGDNGGLWAVGAGSCLPVNGGDAVRVVSNVGPIPTPVSNNDFVAYFPPSIFPPVGGVPANPPIGLIGGTMTVTYLDGRQPGKLNINMMTDIEAWRALCDAQPANTFNPPLRVPLPASPLAFGGGALVPALTPVPIRIPVTSDLAFAGGPPDVLRGSINGVDWLLREGDPGGAFRGSFIEFNDPIRGRETVEVMNIVDNSGAGTPHFEINYIALDHNLNRLALPLNARQLDHQRNAANPFPIAVDYVSETFQYLVASRTARPFLGMASGFIPPGDAQYSSGTSVVDTLLRNDVVDTAKSLFQTPRTMPPPPALPPAFQPIAHHPQRAHELLNKVANNVTTRSNVFAVWLTVGYFEVDTLGRVGREIGRADSRQVRHRYFAIVDRSVLDSYVQQMNALIRIDTQDPAGNPTQEYDVASSARTIGAGPAIPLSTPSLILPLVGNQNLDPRRPYTAVVTVQPRIALPPPPPVTYNVTLPPPVLYWSMIE
jgi:hypothetical protein